MKNRDRITIGVGVGLILVGNNQTHWLSTLIIGLGGFLIGYELSKK